MSVPLGTKQPSATQDYRGRSLQQAASRQSRVGVGWLSFGAVVAERVTVGGVAEVVG